jgi:hypothetical protein
MVVISIERYRLVCFPFAKQCTLRAAQFMIAGFAIFSFSLSSRHFAVADVIRINLTGQINSTQGYYCSLSTDSDLKSVEDIFHYVDICVHVVIISSLIVFYSQIVRKIIQSKKNIKSHDQMNTISSQKRTNTTGSSSDFVKMDFKNSKSDDSAFNSDKSNVDEVSISSPAITMKRNKISNLKSSLNISVKTDLSRFLMKLINSALTVQYTHMAL